MRRRVPARSAMWVAMLLLPVLAAGCRTQEDAVAAAQQMAQTAQAMHEYYAAEKSLVESTEGLLRAQEDLNGVPVSAVTLGHLDNLRTEMEQRERLAHALGELAEAFAEITNSQAAADAAKAAASLNAELVSLKVEPDSAAAATALRVAVTSLVNAVRAHDEVRAAKVLAPVLQAMGAFFDTEKPAYVSLGVTFYTTAASNAQILIDQHKVAPGPRYRTSLEPFGLEAQVSAEALSQAARDEMKRDVEAKAVQRRQESRDAADAMAEALHRMQARVEVVASRRAMGIRVPPLSLAGVRAWVAEIEAETGVSR